MNRRILAAGFIAVAFFAAAGMETWLDPVRFRCLGGGRAPFALTMPPGR